jgi:fatty-acyl-CoA synthase
LVARKQGADVAEAELIKIKIKVVRDAKGAVQAPKSIEFVEELPVTGLGKLDKKAIRARYWRGQTRGMH